MRPANAKTTTGRVPVPTPPRPSGILGYGSIGRQTARLARALGMTVHAYTHRPRPTPESRRDRAWSAPGMGDPDGVLPSKWFSAETGTEFPGEEGKRHGDGQPKRGLHAFLASGLDLLVVATPLTAQTRGLLGRAEFDVLARAARGRRKAFVCNVARGEVVDTPALVAALEQGAVRGAAVDVTDPEPLPEHHPLWRAPNVIITPHVSGASTRYFERVLAILEENLRRLGEGAELVNRVDRERGY